MIQRKQGDKDWHEVRNLAQADLLSFITLVAKGRVLGDVHKEVIQWWERPGHGSHQLLLLPRDHMKSALLAYRCAWRITKDPAVRILYISSTANLAVKQLKFIKDILTSSVYQYYWPEMVHPDEGKREKWTESEISVDHPLRKAEAIRDPTVFAAGLTTGVTGMHCDVSAMDDTVVRENAYTAEGRRKVEEQYSQLSSIEAADAESWVVGTRYFPLDLYNTILTTNVEVFDEFGDLVVSKPLFEVFERQVEDRGDGTGQFLWPRQRRYDGKEFGFNTEILARKKAQYIDKTQFRAQYYNDPNSIEENGIQPNYFQYYDRQALKRVDGKWYLRNRRLSIAASIDFAFTTKTSSDYTAIVVVGLDADRNYYVLDIDRFRTDKIGDYYTRLLYLHQKWDFRKVRAEVTAGQSVIVTDIKQNYIARDGLALSVDESRPNRHEGSKEERVYSTLQPRYQNLQMWHYRGGNCQVLEDELILRHPPHDDVKDALASAVDFVKPPPRALGERLLTQAQQFQTHPRFGGIV